MTPKQRFFPSAMKRLGQILVPQDFKAFAKGYFRERNGLFDHVVLATGRAEALDCWTVSPEFAIVAPGWFEMLGQVPPKKHDVEMGPLRASPEDFEFWKGRDRWEPGVDAPQTFSTVCSDDDSRRFNDRIAFLTQEYALPFFAGVKSFEDIATVFETPPFYRLQYSQPRRLWELGVFRGTIDPRTTPFPAFCKSLQV